MTDTAVHREPRRPIMRMATVVALQYLVSVVAIGAFSARFGFGYRQAAVHAMVVASLYLFTWAILAAAVRTADRPSRLLGRLTVVLHAALFLCLAALYTADVFSTGGVGEECHRRPCVALPDAPHRGHRLPRTCHELGGRRSRRPGDRRLGRVSHAWRCHSGWHARPCRTSEGSCDLADRAWIEHRHHWHGGAPRPGRPIGVHAGRSWCAIRCSGFSWMPEPFTASRCPG